MKIKNPLVSDRNPTLECVVYNNLKPTFGTGIHTITPAHDVDDLRISYAHNLDRHGAVSAESGFLVDLELTQGQKLSPFIEKDHVLIMDCIKETLG